MTVDTQFPREPECAQSHDDAAAERAALARAYRVLLDRRKKRLAAQQLYTAHRIGTTDVETTK